MQQKYNEHGNTDSSKTNVFAEFLQSKGLYASIEITQENIMSLRALVAGEVKLDMYCKTCGEKRVFTMQPIKCNYMDKEGNMQEQSLHQMLHRIQLSWKLAGVPNPGGGLQKELPDWYWSDSDIVTVMHIMSLRFTCAMDNSHEIVFVVRTEGDVMQKIGQIPSIADISFPEIENYKKVLSKENRKEFRRAIGLYANGIGVGSYVYLRRIFERVLETAKSDAVADGINLQGYDKARTDERIKMLKEYLPQALVERTVFYGIVSKGIHELSEEECLEYFPVLRDFLILTIKQWERKRQEKEAEKQLVESVSKIARKIK